MEQEPQTPNLTPEPQAPPAPVPTDPTTNATEPATPKKKKTGLIVGIILAILILCGAGIAIFFLLQTNSNPAKNATTNFLDTYTAISTKEQTNVKNRNLKIDGKIDIKATYDYNATFNLAFEANDSAQTHLVFGIDKFPMVNLDSPITIEAKAPSANEAYLKLSGLNDILSSLLPLMGDNAYDIFYLLEEIDDSWIKIDLEDLASENVIDDLSGNNGGEISSEQATCLVEKINKESILISKDDITKIFSLEEYKGNDKTVEKGKLYLLKINKDEAESLMDRLTEKIKSFAESCEIESDGIIKSNSLIDSLESDIIASPTIDTNNLPDNLPDMFVVIDNDEITRFFTDFEDDGTKVSLSFDFSYPSSIEIKAPDDSIRFTDLLLEIQEISGGIGGGDTLKCSTGYVYDGMECIDKSPDLDLFVDQVYDYVMGSSSGETMADIPEDEVKDVIYDYVVCLQVKGVDLLSVDEDKLIGDSSNEEAKECYGALLDDFTDLFLKHA